MMTKCQTYKALITLINQPIKCSLSLSFIYFHMCVECGREKILQNWDTTIHAEVKLVYNNNKRK